MDVRISNMAVSVQTIDNLTKQLQAEFAPLMKDKSIPVAERWELFCNAPESLKGHDPYWTNFDILEQHGISFYDDLYIDRYQTVHTVDLVDQVLHGSIAENRLVISVEELAEILKEEILQDNLGTFRFDW